jgi:hypothetical protein|nr:MAG TPA: pulmonary surfactant-associated protein [Caudoviricetes sp.]
MSTRIDLTREIRDWEEAVYGEEVRSANSRALQKIQNSVNEAIDDVNQSAQNINTTLSDLEPTIARANAAANTANTSAQATDSVRNDIVRRLQDGEFKGDKGDRGEKGATGASGVTATTSGFFTLEVDASGDLYVVTPDGGTPPNFEYEQSTGNLYLIVD